MPLTRPLRYCTFFGRCKLTVHVEPSGMVLTSTFQVCSIYLLSSASIIALCQETYIMRDAFSGCCSRFRILTKNFTMSV